jgi:phosphohistidine phosphatase SixA
MDMQKFIFSMIIASCFFSSCSDRDAQLTTFILLRHAEKGNDGTEDPDLTPEGIARASRLSQFLSDAQIDGIYATNYKRTRNTVTPLAASKSLQVASYEAFKDNEIERILQAHQGETIVMCGHSDNIPWTANLLLGKETFKEFNQSEYSIILIVTVSEKGKVANVVPVKW